MKGYGWILQPDARDENMIETYREFHRMVLKEIARLEGKSWVIDTLNGSVKKERLNLYSHLSWWEPFLYLR